MFMFSLLEKNVQLFLFHMHNDSQIFKELYLFILRYSYSRSLAW